MGQPPEVGLPSFDLTLGGLKPEELSALSSEAVSDYLDTGDLRYYEIMIAADREQSRRNRKKKKSNTGGHNAGEDDDSSAGQLRSQ